MNKTLRSLVRGVRLWTYCGLRFKQVVKTLECKIKYEKGSRRQALCENSGVYKYTIACAQGYRDEGYAYARNEYTG